MTDKKTSIYKDVIPLTKGMFADTKISKEKMLATLHRSVLGLDKLGRARPLEDMKIFLLTANQYKLNPFKKELYATYIWDSMRQREELIPIVSIHGLRKICRKSEMPTYTHTGACIYKYDDNDPSKLVSAEVPVFGYFTDQSKIVEITRYTAFMDEFARTKKDGNMNAMWRGKPRVMLAKCAEANALRLGFDISGLYIEEEISGKTVIDIEPEEVEVAENE